MNSGEYIEKNQIALTTSLQEMIAINTVNPPGLNYRPMVELLEQRILLASILLSLLLIQRIKNAKMTQREKCLISLIFLIK